jgi:hypothetical protein
MSNMALTMKDRYARLDLSKLPESYKSEFEEMDKSTYGFTDEDLNDVFVVNFNDMYELVEKKYPGAIKTGGTVKKVKPAKVKSIKPKEVKRVEDARDFLANLTEEQKKIMDNRMRKKLSADDIEFIESTMRNDEASTDEEMIAHFVKETGMTEAQAKKWVILRGKYLAAGVLSSISYKERTGLKKEKRSEKDIVKTRDGKEFDRKDKKNVGKTFYDENGKAWKCKEYNAKLDECILQDSDGKLMASCIRDMYTTNPVAKREKGNLVDECKETLKDAGFTVKEHRAGKKKIRRSEPRPDKAIIKERIEEAFTPITKDLGNSEEKAKENKEMIKLLDSIKALFTKFLSRVYNLADDNKIEQLRKVEKLLKEIID